MQEEVIFRRRDRLKKHFVNVSNVLLYCYAFVSDAAKITFQVIDGFDWESKETGDSKGFVFPAIETIARIRHTSIRTIQRHILELIKAKLLTRIRQRNKPSILYIEEVSEAEVHAYFQFFDAKEKTPTPVTQNKPEKSRNDIFVVSHKAPETTKMSFAYMKENEMKENEINVNAILQISEPKKRYGMQGVGDILHRFDLPKNTTRTKGQPEEAEASTNTQKNTARNMAIRQRIITQQSLPKPRPKKPMKKISLEEKEKRNYYATQMATELNDEKSLGCYRVIAEKVPQHIIFETLSSVKGAWQEGKITKSRGALFVDLIKTYCDKKMITLEFTSPNKVTSTHYQTFSMPKFTASA